MIVFVFIAVVVILTVGALTACATVRGVDGRDYRVLTLPNGDDANETLKTAAAFLPPPWNFLAEGVLGLFAVGGAVGTAHGRGSRKGWDENDDYHGRTYRPRGSVMKAAIANPVTVGGPSVPQSAVNAGGGAA